MVFAARKTPYWVVSRDQKNFSGMPSPKVPKPSHIIHSPLPGIERAGPLSHTGPLSNGYLLSE